MYRLIALLIGYAIGCIQMAYIVGKLKGIDIRDHGSKNAGMTNVTRTIGKRAGMFVFAFDMLKGAIAFLIAMFFLRHFAILDYSCAHRAVSFMWRCNWCDTLVNSILPGMYGSLGAILGHCFPVWLKFRGGKGVSCFLVFPFLIDWRVGAVSLAIALAVLIPTRYISLGSLVYSLTATVAMLAFRHEPEAAILMAAISALIWFLHRENIKRLLNGTERKFLSKKQ
jgi:glycerol-3-phosphate acyltransferase PlsY